MRWLGSITAASGAYNNWQTGVSGIGAFTIPKGVRSLYLQPSASGIFFEVGSTGLATDPTRGALLPYGPAAGAILGNVNAPAGPFRVPSTDGNTVVALYNSVGGFVSCKVFGSDGPG